MALFYRISHKFLQIVFRSVYRHKVFSLGERFENLDFPHGAIIAANHLSFLDPPLIAISSSEDVYFLARGSLFNNPIFKTIITNLNAQPIGSGGELQAIKTACKLLKEGKKIILFPEGTRSVDGKIQPFKKGVGVLAQMSEAAIIPTYVHGTFDVWPKNRALPHLFGKRTACVFGKPVYINEFENIDKKEVSGKISERIYKEITMLQNHYLEKFIPSHQGFA